MSLGLGCRGEGLGNALPDLAESQGSRDKNFGSGPPLPIDPSFRCPVSGSPGLAEATAPMLAAHTVRATACRDKCLVDGSDEFLQLLNVASKIINAIQAH